MHHGFICPVCGKALQAEPKRFFCPAGHSFDRAAAGYVNLSRSQTAKAKRHGDDKRMIRARTAFLATGAYRILSDALVEKSAPLLASGDTFLDAGIGEGHYTALLAERLRAEGKSCTLMGIDLSRDALIAASRRDAALLLAVASVYHLPVADGSLSLIWNIFAPTAGEEYARCLKKGGYLLRAFPLEEHLMGLKQLIYDSVYPNRPQEPEFADLELLSTDYLRTTLVLDDPVQIADLFAMTPYYYKTSAADQQKIAALGHLETPLAFGLSLYRKK